VIHPDSARPEQPKPAAKPVAKRDGIAINVQNNSITLNVGVGDQTVSMLLDTGATNSMVTQAIAEVLVSSNQARWSGEQRFTMADGSVRTAQTVVINEVRIGNHLVRNVKASVTRSTEMLLGFSVLKAIGPFMIDTRTNELIFMTTEAALQEAGQ
jgi:clan AA aspartic protease (TIGR02281 family)